MLFPHSHLKHLPVSVALSLKHHGVPLHSTLCKNDVSSLLLMPELLYCKRSFGFPLEPFHWDNYTAISHTGLQEGIIMGLHIPRESGHCTGRSVSYWHGTVVGNTCLWLCWKEIRWIRWIEQLILKDISELNDINMFKAESWNTAVSYNVKYKQTNASLRDLSIDRQCSKIPFIVTTAEGMPLWCVLFIDWLPTGWGRAAWEMACGSQADTAVISLVPYPQ